MKKEKTISVCILTAINRIQRVNNTTVKELKVIVLKAIIGNHISKKQGEYLIIILNLCEMLHG